MGYTKGEWTLNKEQDFWGKDHIVIRGYESGRIKRIANTWDEANAHLIAASPALYEALRGILSDFVELAKEDCYELYENNIEYAKEAIAKVRGK